jgi:Rieske Fe-S protein
MDKDRRKLCQAACAALCAVPIPLIGCNNNPNIWTIVGFKAGDVQIDSVELAQVIDPNDPNRPGYNFYFCRDAGGLYVLDGTCSHMHCVLAFDPANPGNMQPLPGFHCNCHGSTFDYNGQLLTPPAPAAMTHYQLTVERDGTLVVDTSVIVDPATRTAG